MRLQGSFTFGKTELFGNVSLTLPAAQWTCLLGTSGVGKSTLLRLFAGLDTGGEFNGSVRADDGQPIENRIAYMAQSDLLLPWLSVRQNVALGNRLRNQAVDADRVDALINSIGLAEHADKKPAQLSGGMRQRTALARTLMEDTPLVLLDEPFSALDARTRSEMQSLAFAMLHGKTVLLVTHDPAEAVRLGHQLLVMNGVGLHKQSLPSSLPVRPLEDKDVLQAQASLLLALQT